MNEFKGWYKFPNETLEAVQAQMERMLENGAIKDFQTRQGETCPEARWTYFVSL